MENNNTPEIRFVGFNEDWERRKLGELIEISSAARVHKNEWTTSGVRFFRSSDVVSSFIGKKNIPAYISYSLYGELSKKSGLVQPGDLLVTGGGSIGIPYLVTDQEPLYFKDADLIWLKSANKIDGYFLYYYFVTPQLRKYISSITHIGTISHYTIEQSKDTPIVLPKQLEQNLIGNFFKQLDDKITLHQQELTTLKQTKQGFLQKMFPKEGESVPEVRFPGFTGEWEERMLGEILKVNSGKDYKHLQQGDIPVYGTSGYMLSVNGKLSDENAIGIGRKGTIDHPQLLKAPFWTVDTLFFMTTKEKNDLLFCYSLANKINWKKYDESTGVPSLSKASIVKISVRIPTLAEQEKIGNFFKQLDDTIALHQRELDALKETKKAFLQKMFV
ncbi:restriction endonuclease subunit S [Bacillus sp. T17B1]|uniref:restriction endonuclease subunit S n=1 Tax=Bacillus sp. T17B1 TaxID=2918911 RepID=UPI0022800BE1|nr:restriction endonuclease subunit S [Bacillus sp. T17B1]